MQLLPSGWIGVTEELLSINKELYREWLCEYIVDVIVAQWLDWCERRVHVKQDNTSPHIHQPGTWVESLGMVATT